MLRRPPCCATAPSSPGPLTPPLGRSAHGGAAHNSPRVTPVSSRRPNLLEDCWLSPSPKKSRNIGGVPSLLESGLDRSPDLLPYTADVETMPIIQETQLSSG